MMKTTFEMGFAKAFEMGFALGFEKGMRRAIWIQVEKKFGPLSPLVQRQLEKWPAERLEELVVAIVDTRSLCDLKLDA